jgi:hypothetical protein
MKQRTRRNRTTERNTPRHRGAYRRKPYQDTELKPIAFESKPQSTKRKHP